ncbi:hypothetical protein ACFRCI_45525 [Streptomyces sp. NPDC056638]|uniref:hypothetical protein n=1 Tax=Streptomyces sp. NPDC056638 TaxID=3345887 RepID=UPI00369C2095
MSDTPAREDPATPGPKSPVPPSPAPKEVLLVERTGEAIAHTGEAVAVFAATATLLPFLQALGTTVGTRVGERLNDATRGTLRRILRRELERETPRAGRPLPGILTTPAGTRIRFDTDTPEEALPQLLAMTFERLEQDVPDLPALVRWTPTGWLATVASAGQLYDLNWDPEQTEWVPAPSPPTPPTS